VNTEHIAMESFVEKIIDITFAFGEKNLQERITVK
jgi:hypothetical protein